MTSRTLSTSRGDDQASCCVVPQMDSEGDDSASLELCSMGCGLPVHPGLDRHGQPFKTCCKGCALKRGHDAGCRGRADEKARAAKGDEAVVTVDPIMVPTEEDLSRPERTAKRPVCRMGCGFPVTPGRDWRGRHFTTCCRACASGRGTHDERCGLPFEPVMRRATRRAAQFAPLWDPVWGEIELRRLKHGERPKLRRRCAVAGFACCPCLVITCGCFRGEVWSGLSQAEVKMAWRRMLCSWSMVLAVTQVLVLLAPLVFYDGYAPVANNVLLGPRLWVLDKMGAKNAAKILLWNEWWRLFTPMVLHAGWVHLLGNLLLQLRTGMALEVLWGSTRWIFIYVVSGFYASLSSCVFTPGSISVGSSGALCGLVGAWLPFILITWHQTLPRDVKLRNAQLFIVITSIILCIPLSLLPMVDWAAHFGGTAAGMASSMLVFAERHQTRRWRVWTSVTGLVGIAGLFAVTFWLLFTRIRPPEQLLYICSPSEKFTGDACVKQT